MNRALFKFDNSFPCICGTSQTHATLSIIVSRFTDLLNEEILWSSEALPVDDRLTHGIVLFLGDPHIFELFDLREDGTTEPAWIFTVGWWLYSRSHVWRCQGSDFFPHALLHALEHSATSSQHNILKEVSLDVRFALEDRVEGVLLKAVFSRLVLEAGLEEHLGNANKLLTHCNHVAVR